MSIRVILATLAGAVVSFLLGWLVFGILAMDFYTANTNPYPGLLRETPSLIGIFLSNCCMAFLLAYIYDRWAGITDFVSGAASAVAIVIPITASFNVYLWATMNLFGKKLLLLDIVLNAVVAAVVGGVVALVLGFRKN